MRAGIFGYPFGTDEQIAVNSAFGIGKGDNIGVVVVPQVFDIDLPQIFVGTENDIQFVNRLFFRGRNFQQPIDNRLLCRQFEFDVFKIEGNKRFGFFF